MTDLKIGIVGAAGRMGRMLISEVAATEGCALIAATEQPDDPAVGQDAGELAGIGPLGVQVSDDAVALFATCQAVIDFTAPAASVAHAALAAQGKTVHIIGTTGLDPAQESALLAAAEHTVIVRAPNMSLGVNLLLALVEQVAGTLDAEFDIEIVEMHHRKKADAPSGTALALGRAAAAGRGVEFETVAKRARDGITGPRTRGEIGFATLRGGDVVGEHHVLFAGVGERIELAHQATDRRIFARGAIAAALWAHGQPPGLYSMADVLGLGD
jgi:4-hydroxy-tetrahydrodipicolinate reductase